MPSADFCPAVKPLFDSLSHRGDTEQISWGKFSRLRISYLVPIMKFSKTPVANTLCQQLPGCCYRTSRRQKREDSSEKQ
jgi:hypothetical protein